MAMSNPFATPQKRRRTSQADLESHIGAAMAAGSGQDADFVHEQMDNNENVSRALASILRTPAFSRALDKAKYESLKPLGPALKPKVRTFGQLSRPFKWNTFFALLARHRADDAEPDEWVIRDSTVEALLFWALQVQKETQLPQRHVHERFEKPMFLVLVQRYVDQGERLAGLTPANVHLWGDFVHNPDGNDLTMIRARFQPTSHRTAAFNMITHDQMSAHTDWEIHKNLEDGAELVSVSRNVRMAIRSLFTTAHPDIIFTDRKESFEYPNAANELQAVQVPQDIQDEVRAAAKAKAKAKAMAAGPRRPARGGPVAVAAPPS